MPWLWAQLPICRQPTKHELAVLSALWTLFLAKKMGVLITGIYSDHFIKGESFKGTIQAFGYIEAEGTFTVKDGEFEITGDDGTTVEVTQTGNFRTVEITGDGFEIKSENLITE